MQTYFLHTSLVQPQIKAPIDNGCATSHKERVGTLEDAIFKGQPHLADDRSQGMLGRPRQG